MSIDPRLREGLQRSAAVVDPDLLETLPDALDRGRRRRRLLRASRAIVAIACLAVVAAALPQLLRADRSEQPAVTPTPPVPPEYAAIAGTYTATIEPDSNLLRTNGMVGTWSLALDADGVMLLAAPPGFTLPSSPASFEVHGSRFVTNAFAEDACNGMVGTYSWELSEGRLRFTKITDGCPIREAIFGSRQWGMVSPAGVPSSAPAATPVVPDDGSQLVPGTYATTFQPQLRLTVGRGWTGNADTSDWIDIRRDRSDAAGALSFFRIESVVDPTTKRPTPLPQDLVVWFTSHPAVSVVSPPRTVTLGGVQATRFDVELALGWRCGNPSCVNFARLSPGEPHFGWGSDSAPGLRSRILVLRVQGNAVVVTFTSSKARFPDGVRAAAELLSTVEFG